MYTLSGPKQESMLFCRVQIKSSMLYREKLYENLLVLASSCEIPLRLSLTDRENVVIFYVVDCWNM